MLSSTLLFAITAASLAQTPLDTQFEVSQPSVITIETQQPTYFRGQLTSDSALNEVVILNQQNKVIKPLLPTGERQSDIFWFAPEPDTYRLQITPLVGKTAQVSVQLTTWALKEDQQVSPDHPLLSPWLIKVQKAINAGDKNAETQFWQHVAQQGTPLIEPDKTGSVILTFLWKGEVSNVRVLGSPYEGHAHLARLPNSQIWYKSYVVPDDTRLSYRLAPNVPQLVITKDTNTQLEQRRAVLATAQPDPLNQQPIFAQDDTYFGAASTLTLAHAMDDTITQPLGNPVGNVESFHYVSQRLGNERRISLYSPHASYPLTPSSPLLILFDGDAYLNRVSTPTILDNLIAQQKIPPLRAIFINPALPSLRAKELTPNPEFADFMAHEFMPFLCKTHHICPTAANTLLSGSSFGGLAAMAIALRHPSIFGKVLSQSGSFWWKDKGSDQLWALEQVAQSQSNSLSIYLNAGRFEQNGADDSILATNRLLYDALNRKGYPVIFQEASSGHDYFAWRVMLAHGLIQLFKNKS